MKKTYRFFFNKNSVKKSGPVPYNFILHTSPNTEAKPKRPLYWQTVQYDYHWHFEIIPRLTRVAGFEWGSGFYINSVDSNVNFYLDGTTSLNTAYRYRVKAFNATNESVYSDEVSYDPVSVDDFQIASDPLKIYPNPVSDVACVEFYLNEGIYVDVSIVDVNGKAIHSLANTFYGPGRHKIPWSVNNSGVAIEPGLYVCILKTGRGIKSGKFSVIR